jgi:hypothetical protein
LSRAVVDDDELVRHGDADVRAALEQILAEQGRPIVALERSPHAYRQSAALEELRLTLDDGSQLDLVFKDLGDDAVAPEARGVKPAFLRDSRREIEVYRSLLAGCGLDTPALYGAVVDESRGRFWLFIEKVAGDPLWEVGEFALWEEAARTLRRIHEALGSVEPGVSVPLIRYDGELYRRWFARAEAFAAGRERASLRRIAACHEQVVERLLELPVSVIHGELFAANVVVARRDGRPRICVVDWETGSLGLPHLDLAALSAGSWGADERRALATAYYDAATYPLPPPDTFFADVERCRLHLAVRLLGWAESWTPPPWQRQDWLGEALRLADALDG